MDPHPLLVGHRHGDANAARGDIETPPSDCEDPVFPEALPGRNSAPMPRSAVSSNPPAGGCGGTAGRLNGTDRAPVSCTSSPDVYAPAASLAGDQTEEHEAEDEGTKRIASSC